MVDGVFRKQKDNGYQKHMISALQPGKASILQMHVDN